MKPDSKFSHYKLKRLRVTAGLSVATLAGTADITQMSLYGYESGAHEPKVSNAAKLAHALGVKIEDLLRK